MELARAILQDGVPLLVVACAAVWLLRRWTRPAPKRCAGCDAAAVPRAQVRHRLRVLGAED